MDMVAVGFWGAFFGAAGLSFLGAIAAFTHSVRRVALTGSVSALISAAYVVVFLGWVPVHEAGALMRLQGYVALASSTILGLILFAFLGTLKLPGAMRAVRWCLAFGAPVALVAVGVFEAHEALGLALAVQALIVVAAIAAAATSAAGGQRAGRLALAALPFMTIAIAALDWYAFDPGRTHWTVHAVGAIGGIGYFMCIATAMWMRYAYLIELSEVMTHGPDYDAITRMPWWQPGHLGLPGVGNARSVGILVVTISNLRALEELHGHAAANHALFVCASRLRRVAAGQPRRIELRRLDDDAFIAFVPHPREMQEMMTLGRAMLDRLARPVLIGTSVDIASLDSTKASWEANLGFGLVIADAAEDPDVSVAHARDVARTAWTYGRRIAWFDDTEQRISEVPA